MLKAVRDEAEFYLAECKQNLLDRTNQTNLLLRPKLVGSSTSILKFSLLAK